MHLLLITISLLISNFANSAIEWDGEVIASSTTLDGLGTPITLVSEVQSGSSAATASNVYYPVSDGSGALSDNFTYYNDNYGLGFRLPIISSGYADIPYIRLLDVGHDQTSDSYIQVAAYDGSSYIVINKVNGSANFASVNSTSSGYLDLKISALCSDYITSCKSDMDSFIGTPAIMSDYQLLYIFSAATAIAAGQPVDPTNESYDGGMYVKIYYSSDASTISSITPTLVQLKRGDGQLKATYSISSSLTDMHGVVFILNPTSNGVNMYTAATPGDPDSIVWEDVHPTTSSTAEITISNLQNGVQYYFAVAVVNKYGFATLSSNIIAQTPTEIEAFLEAKACYFFSAGFQEESFVIDYFQKFRDEVLLQNRYGKMFVNFYYDTAPKYTYLIYESEVVSFIVRCVGYVIYFIFNFYYLFLIFIPFIFVARRVQKALN